MKKYLFSALLDVTKSFPQAFLIVFTLLGVPIIYKLWEWHGLMEMAVLYLVIFNLVLIVHLTVDLISWFYKKW
jgi:hypothetical protein